MAVLNLDFETYYPQPIEKVWEAITSSEALGRWLMPNDFEPVAGRTCVFRFCASEGEPEKLVYVTVDELRPPRFMKWTWRDEDGTSDTTVTFELEPAGEGTTVRLRHAGAVSPSRADKLGGGWREKLAELRAILSG